MNKYFKCTNPVLFACILCALLLALTTVADGRNGKQKENEKLWLEVARNTLTVNTRRTVKPEKYSVFRLNQNLLEEVFAAAPLEFTDEARRTVTILELPTPDGKIMRFRIENSPIFEPELAAKYPTWKTMQGYGIDDPTLIARFDWNFHGFHAQVLAPDGKSFYVDPFAFGDTQNYIVYYKQDLPSSSEPFRCDFDNAATERGDEDGYPNPFKNFYSDFSHGTQLRTYRLAIAVTGEYTAVFGGTVAGGLAAVQTTTNRVVGVFRKDFAVSFTLVANNNLLIYTNVATDPYTNAIDSGQLNINQTNINTVIGSTNYDVGHLFATSNNGLAQLASFCGSGKARGASGQPNPQGDGFDVDYVAHEIGHQIGANHSFNSDANCGSGNDGTRVEPGSGVTIMSYVGICTSSANLQRNAIDAFHVVNQTEGINFITTGAGNTCGTLSGTNAVPVIAALANYTIPTNTPFALTASATDANGDALTYSWEQNDGNLVQSFYPTTTDDDDISLVPRPAFRSYSATTSGTRNFPSLPYILDGTNEPPLTYTGTSVVGSVCAGTCITGEDLPSSPRTMNFRVTVRDGNGGLADAGTVLTVVNTLTPFRVTVQDSFLPVTWQSNSTQTVTWDNAGTDIAPFNVTNVRILLSADGGLTFPHVLAASTPNDGTEQITVPNIATTTARIKVEAVGNVFFDINNVNFEIEFGPTSAMVNISGRVLSTSGRGVSNALVILTDNTGAQRFIRSTTFGYYHFGEVSAGQIYTLGVSHKGHQFSPRVISVKENLEGINFIANP